MTETEKWPNSSEGSAVKRRAEKLERFGQPTRQKWPNGNVWGKRKMMRSQRGRPPESEALDWKLRHS